MRRPLIVFGAGEIAEIANYYFNTDSQYEIKAFTVDSDYINESNFCRVPVIPFEDISKQFPSSENDFFIALGYSKLNSVRRNKFISAKKEGYKLVSYVSSRSMVLNSGNIGENCFVLEGSTIQPFVKIGNNVTLWSGSTICHHSVIHDHTFVASHVVVSGGVEVGEQCFLGANAILRDHIKIGDRCVVGAGALLLADAAADGVYRGFSTERLDVSSARLREIGKFSL